MQFIWLTQASEAAPCVEGGGVHSAEPSSQRWRGPCVLQHWHHMVITHSVTAKLLRVLPEDAALPHCPDSLSPGLTIHKKNQRQHQRERPPSSHPWPVW